MTHHALYVQLEAKPGKEQEVANFLSSARTMVSEEPRTTAWFAIRMGPRMFGIFDAFANERGRDAHLQGKDYAACGRLTIADFALASMARYWRESTMPLDDFRNIVNWLEGLMRLSAWAEPWPV